MASHVYPIGLEDIVKRLINYTADALDIALLTSSFTFNPSDTTWAAVSANEVAGTGYTAGGQALTGLGIGSFVNANSWTLSWAATTTYAVGQVVKPTAGNGFLYACVVAGTSAGSEPTWPTTVGLDVTDGPVTWECVGVAAVVFTANPATWTASTITAAWAVIYDHTVADTLVCALDFGGNVSSVAGDFVVSPDATSGFFLMVTG